MLPARLRSHTKPLLFCLALGLLLFSSGVHHGVTAQEETYEKLKVFTEVLSIVQSNYVDDVNSKDLLYGAVRGMLETLDPHSSFMSPDNFREMQVETQGSFGGLGIEITVKDRQLTVVAPIEGTPADRVGLLAGDKIVQIDGKPTKDLTLMEAVRRLRGPRGSKVTISILREGLTEPKDIEIIREVISVKSVRSKDLGEGVGYVRVNSFQERTGKDLEQTIDQLTKAGANAFVLDLRNNPGGLLNQAVYVSDLFLDKGQLIVYTSGRIKNQDLRFTAEHSSNFPKFPMVVLVNGGSASASEIVAGALQDHKRAVVLGTKTFGKGSVQTVIPLTDGSGLRLTTAKYFTPKGRSIHGTGLEPDILVEPAKPPQQAGAQPHQPLREADLQRGARPVPPKERKIGEEDGDPAVSIGRPEVGDVKTDVQLQRALEILKATKILEKSTAPAPKS